MLLKSGILLLAVTLQVYGQSDLPIVETANGKIQGIVRKELDMTYLLFQGVPYANPPIGSRRFAPPERKTAWTGTWVANTTYTCIQVDHQDPPQEGVTKGDEDCLYLDIYVPGNQLNSSANLDVMAYFPGDAFMYGSSSQYVRPTPFLAKTVVFISINYRLGIFGFLSLEDKVLPGNNGMRDQVMALHWIQENIKLFGGNPDSVTLAGSGAGGASVHFHMMSPLSEGLFHKALSISGLFGVGMAQSVWLQSRANKSSVYFISCDYISEKVPTMPEMQFGIKENYGVAHGDDVILLFSSEEHSKNDSAIRAAVVSIGAYFAKTGKTFHNKLSPVDGFSKKISYLYISSPTDIEMRNAEDLNNQLFWNSLPIMENKRLIDAQTTSKEL